MNYALAHNGISPLKRIVVENDTGESVRELRLEIELTDPMRGRSAAPLRVVLPDVGPGVRLELDGNGVPWAFDAAAFAQLDEAVSGSIKVRVFDAVRTLSAEGTMRLLARDEWWFEAVHESLAAFVTPRARAVRDLLGEASDLLSERTGDPSLQGYQHGADRAMAIAGAIYDAMRQRNIRYIKSARVLRGERPGDPARRGGPRRPLGNVPRPGDDTCRNTRGCRVAPGHRPLHGPRVLRASREEHQPPRWSSATSG